VTSTEDSNARRAADAVHPTVRAGAEWAWRLLVLFAATAAVLYVAKKLETVVVPLLVSLLFAALLGPLVDWMQRQGVPRSLGVVVALVGSLGLFAGIMTFVVEQFIGGLPQLGNQFTHSVKSIQDWLINGPFHLSQDQIRHAGDTIVKWVQKNQDTITSGAFTTAQLVAEIASGALLTLFVTIFYLYSGDQVWRFVTKLIPTPHRPKVRLAGVLAFHTLVGLVRATVAVAAVDAIGIGIGLAILGVPLALPLASIVFITAFIPIIGAFIGGTVAVFIALVTKGLVAALITLAIIVGVMQLESHVLQPFLLGRAVRVHPLAVVLAVASGFVVAGIAGALFAFPLVATLNTAIRSLLSDAQGLEYEHLSTAGAADSRTGVRADRPDDPEKHPSRKPEAPDEPSDEAREAERTGDAEDE
jgi:predicted PurR-regulated permease PerM